MKKMLLSAALGALILSTATATPARATDPVAVGAAIKLIFGVSLLTGGIPPGTGTSVNTQYALTGQGSPMMNNGQLAGAPTMGPMPAPRTRHNRHAPHCQNMMMAPGD